MPSSVLNATLVNSAMVSRVDVDRTKIFYLYEIQQQPHERHGTIANSVDFCYSQPSVTPSGYRQTPVQIETREEEDAITQLGLHGNKAAWIGIAPDDGSVDSPFRWLNHRDGTRTPEAELESEQDTAFSTRTGEPVSEGVYVHWASSPYTYPGAEIDGQNTVDFPTCVRHTGQFNSYGRGWRNANCDTDYYLSKTKYVLCQVEGPAHEFLTEEPTEVPTPVPTDSPPSPPDFTPPPPVSTDDAAPVEVPPTEQFPHPTEQRFTYQTLSLPPKSTPVSADDDDPHSTSFQYYYLLLLPALCIAGAVGACVARDRLTSRTLRGQQPTETATVTIEEEASDRGRRAPVLQEGNHPPSYPSVENNDSLLVVPLTSSSQILII